MSARGGLRAKATSESISELVKKASSVGPRRMKSMRGVQIAPRPILQSHASIPYA